MQMMQWTVDFVAILVAVASSHRDKNPRPGAAKKKQQQQAWQGGHDGAAAAAAAAKAAIVRPTTQRRCCWASRPGSPRPRDAWDRRSMAGGMLHRRRKDAHTSHARSRTKLPICGRAGRWGRRCNPCCAVARWRRRKGTGSRMVCAAPSHMYGSGATSQAGRQAWHDATWTAGGPSFVRPSVQNGATGSPPQLGRHHRAAALVWSQPSQRTAVLGWVVQGPRADALQHEPTRYEGARCGRGGGGGGGGGGCVTANGSATRAQYGTKR